MANLQVKDIHKAYDADVILNEASASFDDTQKIGVIGRNGAGKSTLCRILIGDESPDEGEVIRSQDLRLAYLEQHDSFIEEETVLDFLMRKSGRAHWECGQMAAKFQIKDPLLTTSIRKLSGGYQTRVKLTAMLLGEPNFLILDEPSNYLDLSTLILLENFLLTFKGGFLVVSHDREFLKRTSEHTLEVERGALTLYPGGIEDYFEFKEMLVTQKKSEQKTIEKKRNQLEAFIERFRAKASTASRAKSKMKQLGKLKTIEIAHPMSTVRIAIPPVERKAGMAFSTDELTIGYPEKVVAGRISMEVDRGEHAAILGDNGEGKTTFLRTLAGDLKSLGGDVRWGSGLTVAYYAQHVFATLDPEDNIYAYLLRRSAPGVTSQDVLNIAGSFLFKGDDVKKQVKVLSGGERARLILAGLLLTKSQVLLLDEPTNHLDFETVEALGRALKSFAGTVLFISHDRTFVNLVASTIIEVKNGFVKRYPGTYEDYVYHLELVARGEETDKDPPDGLRDHVPVSGTRPKGAKEKGANEAAATQDASSGKKHAERRREAAQLKRKISKAETRMNNLTRERDKILKQMEDNPFHYSRTRDERLRNLQVAIEEAEEEWLRLESMKESP